MKKLATLLMVAFLAACANQPIYNVTSHPLPSSARTLSLDEIKTVIVSAGQSRGWRFEETGPGRLRARQEQPKYDAVVDISFDTASYNIVYVSTRGMQEQGGLIHPHYNFWIRNLVADIDTWMTNRPIRR